VSLLKQIFSKLLLDVDDFSRMGSGIHLRSYQRQAAVAILQSIESKNGLTIVVIFPRQSGKNELQAQIEAYLLARHYRHHVDIVKVAPTKVPQSKVSMLRLERVLDSNPLTRGRWSCQAGHIYQIGSARITFLSGSPTSNVVGATASLLLECDEAQSVLPSKWDKDFAPMAASANTTTVLWGTAWTSDTLLAREMRAAQALEDQDGIQRLFLMNADQVASEVAAYGQHVANQVARLGREHPLIKTQYFSEEVEARSGMFPEGRQVLMQGDHPPLEKPRVAEIYALLVDVAGEDESSSEGESASLTQTARHAHAATALTVVRVDTTTLSDPYLCAPTYQVVNRYLWSGTAHSLLYGEIKALVEQWKARYVVIDATGIGEGLASFLSKAYPARLIPVTFSLKSKSELGWRFLAIVETGRYKEYASPGGLSASFGVREQGWSQAAVGTASQRCYQLQAQFWLEVQHCQATVLDGPARLMRWGVPASIRHPISGEVLHDDLLISAALCSYLDKCQWGTGESGLIPAIDPLEGLMDVF
jgi:hypothetical protein